MKNFRSEITLKNKFQILKSDLRNLLLIYHFCISSKKWNFYFLMVVQYTIMFRLTSGQKNLALKRYSQTFFFELNFLFNCVIKFLKTVRRPVKCMNFMRYLCVAKVYPILGEIFFRQSPI